MAYMNENFWKNSYLLEFRDSSDTIQDAFAFSMPPQSEDFTYPQRIGETKTFGGVVFEDYGNDTYTINLSGSTFNESIKIIYKGKKGVDHLKGEDEIFYLQSLIEKYGQNKNLVGKKVYLYQLYGGKESGSGIQKTWRVVIKSLQIKRSKDRPFSYDYTLQCYASNNGGFGDGREKKGSKISFITDKIRDFCTNLKNWSNVSKKFLDGVDVFMDILRDLNNCMDEITSATEALYNVVTGSISAVTSAIIETKSIFGNVVSQSLKLTPQYAITRANTAAVELMKACKKMKDWFDEFEGFGKWEEIKSNFDSSQFELYESADDLTDKMSSFLVDTYLVSEEIVTDLKKETSNSTIAINPGDINVDDTIIVTYGYTSKIVSNSDTWEKLSFSTYGTSDYAQMLALYNNDTELKAGEEIYIPIIKESQSNNVNNEVFNPEGTMDNIGKDLKIKNSDFDVFNGDFKTSGGAENLNNAILNRLSTALNSRVRNVVYGIRNTAGENKNVASAYIMSSIDSTIKQDPRVSSVDSIKWKGISDGINIDVTYSTISGKTENLKGAI